MFQRNYVVANLAKIFGTAIHDGSRFGGKQLTERSLCALDLAGQDGLASHERPDENVRIRKPAALSRQSANEAICLR